MHPKGLMLVLSAPSGAGKTTLARRLLQHVPDAVFSVSVTTRAPRDREVDGVDYTFVDEAAFQDMIAKDQLLEWAQVHGATYGTPSRFAVEALEHDRLVVFDIDVQGGMQIKTRHPEAATVLLVPPSRQELERRLRSRGTDSEDVVRRRLEVARSEIHACLAGYDYVVINDDLERAYADLRAIVRVRRGEGSAADQAIEASLRLRAGIPLRAEVAEWERD